MDTLFDLQTPLWDLILRGSLIYLALAVIVRLIPKRHTGRLSPNDLIALVIVGDLVSYALAEDSTSSADMMVLICVVLIWSYLFNILEYYFPRLRHIVQDKPTLLIHDGKILNDNLRKEKLTRQELMASLREHGVDHIGCVRLAVLEVDGQLSVVKRSEAERRKHEKEVAD